MLVVFSASHDYFLGGFKDECETKYFSKKAQGPWERMRDMRHSLIIKVAAAMALVTVTGKAEAERFRMMEMGQIWWTMNDQERQQAMERMQQQFQEWLESDQEELPEFTLDY